MRNRQIIATDNLFLNSDLVSVYRSTSVAPILSRRSGFGIFPLER